MSAPEASPGADSDDGGRRPTIEERRARRAELERPERDRYDSLLRHLQAGREIPIQRRRSAWRDLDIHPSAARIVFLAIGIAIVWLLAVFVTDQMRLGRIATWDGPDSTVQSGLRLDGCPIVGFTEDVYFPAWVRLDGHLYRWANQSAPIGPDSVGVSYTDTGYHHDDLQLYRIISSQDGREGKRIMMRQGGSPAGAIYVIADDCS
jgi:hypothetical protein